MKKYKLHLPITKRLQMASKILCNATAKTNKIKTTAKYHEGLGLKLIISRFNT